MPSTCVKGLKTVPRTTETAESLGVQLPTISIHQPAVTQRKKPAIVICPGGSYSGLAIDKEGHDTARWLNSLGITGVVLKYRLKDYGQPAPCDDVQRAIATVRHRAAELGIDPEKIGVLGYSAGGHLASTAGTHFQESEIQGDKVASRPDFMILVYPVISMDETITHGGSRMNLLGRDPAEDLIESYSNELQVTKSTPPTFIVHSADDQVVPIENSLRMKRALQESSVPVELKVYETGGHGFGLVSQSIPASEWPLRCQEWLRKQGFIHAH